MANRKRFLTKAETNNIIDKLKRGVSINELRQQTHYGVNVLKRIIAEQKVNYEPTPSHKGELWIGVENVFVENSSHSNVRINSIIRSHNVIPHDKCWHCGLSKWLNGPLKLDLDHINGNNRDHRIQNLRYLCPNCHSQTPTFKGLNQNSGNKKVSDEDLITAIKTTDNIRKALLKVGLTPKGGNYERAYKLKLSNP